MSILTGAAPSALTERKTTHNTLTGTVVTYWAILFRQDDEWILDTAEIGDGFSAAYPAGLLATMEGRHGAVEEMAIAGPYWDRETPQRVARTAETSPSFFAGWATMALSAWEIRNHGRRL